MVRPEMSGACLALKDLLSGGEYVAALAEVEGQFDDGIGLDAPTAVYASEKREVASYPAIEVVGLRSIRVSVDQDVEQYHHVIVIVLHLIGDDEETVTAQAQRSIVAMRKLLHPTILEVTGAAPTIVGDEDFEPMGHRKDGGASPFLKVALMEVRVPTFA